MLIEELPDGRCVVFVPSAPVATVGNIFILPRASVAVLDASLTEAAGVITQWGVDAAVLYAPKDKPGSPAD